MTARLLVVSGPPAAGKSTAAPLLTTGPDKTVLLAVDTFFEHIVVGAIPPWLPESAHQNETWMHAAFAAAAAYLDGGYEVILDTVLGPWFVPTLLEHVGARSTDYVLLLPSLTETLRRLVARTGHGFTDLDAATQMHGEITAAAAGFERHVLDPTGMSPSQVAEQIRVRRDAGTLRLAPGRAEPTR